MCVTCVCSVCLVFVSMWANVFVWGSMCACVECVCAVYVCVLCMYRMVPVCVCVQCLREEWEIHVHVCVCTQCG